MAKKKFDDLRGVILEKKDGSEKAIKTHGNQDEYNIVSRGDVIFEIDVENNRTNRCNVKYIVRERGGMFTMHYCGITENRDFKPSYDTFYGRDIPTNMRHCVVMYNKSVYGLIATNLEDASDRLQKIKEGKYLGALKEGDKLYVVDKEHETVIEETVVRTSYNNRWYNDDAHYNITTKNYAIDCYYSEYEENTSVFSDKSFTIYGARCLDDKKFSIHMDKAVADKVLREYLNSRKNVQKKKDEAPKIPVGTPIRHTDNKGQELHYGDVVAYVRKDYWGHTDISFGVVVGDSEKKVKIYDKQEKEELEQREKRWNDRCEDGVHILENVNILRVKEAVKAN